MLYLLLVVLVALSDCTNQLEGANGQDDEPVVNAYPTTNSQEHENDINSQNHRTFYDIELKLKNDLMNRPDLIPIQPPYPHITQFYFYRTFIYNTGYAFAVVEDGHVTRLRH
jgi:hypothetical protein